METATVRRVLNHTLTELKRAIDRYSVAQAADLYALAWQQAAKAPPSETREQRALLQSYKEILGSRRWKELERLRAPAAPAESPSPLRSPASLPLQAPAGRQEQKALWSSGQHARPSDQVPPGRRRARQPALLESARLYEIAAELRPRLEETARAGATITWPLIRKRLPGMPQLHPDDECVVLWLVDEDRREGEPLLSALVTVGDRQMHPRFPAVAEQLGLSCTGSAQQQTAWSYEVLSVHQHWRYRRR